MKYIITLSIASLSIVSNVFGYTISLDAVQLELSKVSATKLGIVVWDQRVQVLDGRQSSGLVGYLRTAAGIAYPATTKGKMPLANLLGNRIESAHQANGTEVEIFSTMPNEQWTQIEQRISKSDCSHYLVIKMGKLEFDGLRQYVYKVELDIEIYDANAQLIHSNHISEERTEKKSLWSARDYKDKMPLLLKAIIEDALNNNDVVAGFSKTSEIKTETQSDFVSDIIITKKGDEIEVKVEEITSETIKYRKASQLDGPLRNIPKSDVFMIKYADGTKEVF